MKKDLFCHKLGRRILKAELYNYKLLINIINILKFKKLNSNLINKMDKEIKQNELVYDRKIITVGYDFYALYQWPEIKREQTIVNGEIKYFRISLCYKKKVDEKEDDPKSICKIKIYYVKDDDIKKGIKKLSLFETNVLDFYKYL